LLDDPPTPWHDQLRPRPDWYFYFLFYLLRIFRGRDGSSSGRSGSRLSRWSCLLALRVFFVSSTAAPDGILSSAL